MSLIAIYVRLQSATNGSVASKMIFNDRKTRWFQGYESVHQAVVSYFSAIIGAFICVALLVHTQIKFNQLSNRLSLQIHGVRRSSDAKRDVDPLIKRLITIYFILAIIYCVGGTIFRTIWFQGYELSCILSEQFLLVIVFSRFSLQVLFYHRFKLVFSNAPALGELGKCAKIAVKLC